MVMNEEVEMVLKEVVVAYIEVLPRNMSERTEENHKTTRNGQDSRRLSKDSKREPKLSLSTQSLNIVYKQAQFSAS
jgi:hypothetical protein